MTGEGPGSDSWRCRKARRGRVQGHVGSGLEVDAPAADAEKVVQLGEHLPCRHPPTAAVRTGADLHRAERRRGRPELAAPTRPPGAGNYTAGRTGLGIGDAQGNRWTTLRLKWNSFRSKITNLSIARDAHH